MTTFIKQRTLKNSIGCTGIGLHTGARVQMVLRPAPEDSGIRFKRTDIGGGQSIIPACWQRVTESQLCSTITDEDGISVKTIEHLMAAFSGAGLDNVLVELNGPEVPIMDGSAAPFRFLIDCVGTVAQDRPRQAIRILKPVQVVDGNREVSLTPAESFSLALEIEFATQAIARQSYTLVLSEGTFGNEIANARTFGFEHEVAMLRAAGLLKGGSLDNAIVVSGDRVLNDTGLRYPDEFVRHKLLDSIGDLYLAGAPILGHFRGLRSGHAMNHRLLQALFDDETAWTRVPMVARDTRKAESPALSGEPAVMPAFGRAAVQASLRA